MKQPYCPRNPTRSNVRIMWVLSHVMGSYHTAYRVAKVLQMTDADMATRRQLERLVKLGFAESRPHTTGQKGTEYALKLKGWQFLRKEEPPNWTEAQIKELLKIRSEVKRCNQKESGTNETK